MLPDNSVSHASCSLVVKEVHSTAQPGSEEAARPMHLSLHTMLELHKRTSSVSHKCINLVLCTLSQDSVARIYVKYSPFFSCLPVVTQDSTALIHGDVRQNYCKPNRLFTLNKEHIHFNNFSSIGHELS